MKNRAQLESIIFFIAVIFLIISAFVYYFYFKTGSVPVFKPKKEIRPAEKGVLPEGTFFPKEEKQQKLPLIFKYSYAKTKNGFKPNKDIETYININFPYVIEDNMVEFTFSAINKKNPLDRFHYMYQLLPLDKKWQIAYFNRKLFNLPKGQNIYTLVVIAVNRDKEYDPTPAYAIFETRISTNYKDIDIRAEENGLLFKNLTNKELNITNWKISTSYGLFSISKGVKDVDHKLSQKEEDIILPPNGSARIIPTTSPTKFNFLPNKCFRYLANVRFELWPYIKRYSYPCDNFSKKEIFELHKKLTLTERCMRFLEKIPCYGPRTKDLEEIKFDIKCNKLIEERFTYHGCYERKKDDKDFSLKEWLIFIPTPTTTIYSEKLKREIVTTTPLYKARYEEIKLYDAKNLIVNRKSIF